MFGLTIVELAIALVIIAAVVGIVYTALREFGIVIPVFVQRIFWIVICCVLAVVAIKFVTSLF